ncbi:MAG: PKD domain-containing protein [Bacteroidia bacterium]|nr:PKD domain-containing protein [Bacteroidia bacterium]MCF8426107.1 PKD domain-containing protein [Bacteroidia bacterium]MCF8447887.1 PKD domain-containing protein [Bacteroidia bacterium]
MKKNNSIYSALALFVLFAFSLNSFLNLEITSVNKHGILFNSKTKIPKKDRMDLAWEQEFELTKDPSLGIVPKERLYDAWKYQQQLFSQNGMHKAAIPGVTWTARGPNNCGGRTRCVLVDLNDPTRKTLWAGSVAGGLWRTTDITATNTQWTSSNDFFDNLAITHIDQAPNNPQVMYFCTGEGNSNLDAVRGLGVWKSVNGGASWSQLAATSNSNYYYCQKVVSIGNGDTLMVLTKTGLYRSVNGGTAFTKVLGTGISSAGNIAYDLEVMANKTIYVTMSTGSSNGGTIHKSYNFGATWTSPLTLPSYFNKDEMEIAVSGTDTNTLYALVESSSKIQGILKTNNAGISFDTVISHPIDADGGVSTSSARKDFSRGQAWYDLSLAVDPNNPNVVVVGGVDLFKTTNGGSSWTQLSHWYGGFGFQEVHADQHYVCFEPGNSNVTYYSNDGGVYRCSNFTASSPTIVSKESNYNTTQFYACDIHPNAGSNQFVAGAQDNGSHALNSPGIGSSIEVTGGDGAFCHIDQDQPQYWFTSYVYTSYYRSTNTGASFSNVLNTSVTTGSFISPSDYDDLNNKMYLCGNNGTFVRWTNPQTGNTLQFDTVPLFNNGKITHVKVSPNTSNRVFFGLNNGRIIRIDNAHINAGIDTYINNGFGMPTGSVSCIEVEDGNDNHIVVTYSNYGVVSVWETKNGGTSWASIEGNLPDMPIRWALLSPNKNWQLMLATELGVWTTDSIRGTTTNWQPSNTGFANLRTDMLKMRGFDKQVLAATHGRGVFTSNVFAPPFADFVADKKVAYIGSNVQFTSTSNGATSYSWNFGDGTFSTSQNPIKQYTLPGFYNVTLSINGGMYSKVYNSFIQIMPFRAVPYTLAMGGNFETNPNDFGVETPSGIAFARGSSSVTGKNGTASGSNAWVTGITGNYSDNNHAILYTPNFNVSATGTYTFRFKAKNKFELGYDGYIVEYSTDLGNNWNPMGTSTQTNWYDFSNASGGTAFPSGQAFFNANKTWVTQSYNFTSIAGIQKICFRFVFRSDDAVTNAGLAIDDFEIVGPTNPAMPVDLVQFYGKRLNETAVKLNWRTASEQNNKGFEVEKSKDGFLFESLGFVAGKGNSTITNDYEFKDEQANGKLLYYRLKQVDFNGNYEYTKVISINQDLQENSWAKLLYLSGGEGVQLSASDELKSLRIISNTGVVVKQFENISSTQVLQLADLAKGIYLVEIELKDGYKTTEKLLWVK